MTSNTFYTLAVFAIVLLIITKPIGLWLTPIAQGRAPAVVDAIDRRLISVLAPSGREESWQRYAVSLLTFNTLGLIFLYVLQRIQGWLPLNPQGFEGVAPDQAVNTAVSFVTNTGSVRISVSGEVIPGAAQRGCPLYLRCSMPDLMR